MSVKQLKIQPVPQKGSVYQIRYEGGGQVPDKLNGLYTSKQTAQSAIDRYNLSKPKRGKKNEQTNS